MSHSVGYEYVRMKIPQSSPRVASQLHLPFIHADVCALSAFV